jgi:Ca2+-transporting ATPase
MFVLAIALAVSAVPEGLPVVLTITLAVGVRRMADRNAIIRRLPAVETLGSTTVIASDKTGTLTENRMTVEHLWAGDTDRQIGEIDRSPPTLDLDTDSPADETLRRTLLAGVLTSEADLHHTDDGVQTSGDPTEIALLVAADRMGLEPERLREHYPTVAEIPFESEQQYSASWHREGDGHVVYAKGAPERILEMCDRRRLDGEVTELDREHIERKAEAMADRGLRVLAVAYSATDAPADDGNRQVAEPEGLCFLGLVGLMDPPRAEVHDAIAGCRAAGIRVLMVTGDHAATAGAIGRELEITPDDAPVLAGSDLAGMSDDQLREQVHDVSVFARVAPDQKLRIVRALQANDHSVAVTGDGVNDAPALNAAEIGIAMGEGGTDVARSASDMVLADDNFASIQAAVEQGRITFDNIRKVTFFLISSGAAEILAILASLAFAWPIPFLPAQILWLNLVTNGLQDIALAFEPREGDVLERPPRRRSEGVVSGLLWERTALAGIVMAVGTLGLFAWELDQSGSTTRAQTVALTTMVLFQMFHVGNARSTMDSIFERNPFSNRFLFIATIAAFLVHVGALYVPATQYVLRVEPIADLGTWLRMALVAATILVAVEAHKLAHRLVRSGEGADRERALVSWLWR